jgi:hypothetical protein
MVGCVAPVGETRNANTIGSINVLTIDGGGDRRIILNKLGNYDTSELSEIAEFYVDGFVAPV